MHPMFVKLFLEPDADDQQAAEEARRRSARQARRTRGATVVKPVAPQSDSHFCQVMSCRAVASAVCTRSATHIDLERRPPERPARPPSSHQGA